MANIKSWLQAFRLRTLPLAMSSILMGVFVAFSDNEFSLSISIVAVITTLFLQILSNLANDYGDSNHGVDNENRIGPKRAVQSGAISPKQMKLAVIIFALLSFFCGIFLLIISFDSSALNLKFILFLILGIAAILSAIKYTAGNNPYGYSGFGDLFVFIFFGLVAVLGTYYLNANTLKWDVVLPAISMGFLSTGVLNLNNMRDIDNDRMNNKITIVVKMGIAKARYYHLFLITIAILSTTIYTVINYSSAWQFVFLVSMPLFYRNIVATFKNSNQKDLNPLLQQLAIATLIFTVLFGAGVFLK